MKKTIKIFLFFSLFILVIMSIYFVFIKKENNILNNSESIFSITIPEDFDEYKIERLENKIVEARKAYEENKDDNWTWIMIGDIYKFVKDYDRAILAYEKSLELQPKDIVSTLNLATIYEKYSIDYDKAEKYYNNAIQILPQSPDVYKRLAKFYWLKMNRIDDAEIIFLEGLDKTNNHSDSLTEIISFYKKTDQLEKERLYIDKLLELYPDNELFQQEYGY